MAQPLLEVKNLSKRFSLGGRRYSHALSGVTLSLARGETLGILGESGCGKSTLAKVIMGVYPPDEGEIFFQGKPLRLRTQRQRKEFAAHAQMIFQDPYHSLDPYMNVQAILEENLMLHSGLDRAGCARRVEELLELTGLLPEYARRFPHEFSGGQRQRIGIARALAVEPQLILCDEPISALDTTIQRHIMNLLIRLKGEMGLTYLFIAHDVSMVRAISDRIAVMYAGRVVELGTAQEVCTAPRHPYTKMLLRSVLPPVADRTRLEGEIGVTGEAVALTTVGGGCPFAPRCDCAAERCHREMPVLCADGDGHTVACHGAEDT